MNRTSLNFQCKIRASHNTEPQKPLGRGRREEKQQQHQPAWIHLIVASEHLQQQSLTMNFTIIIALIIEQESTIQSTNSTPARSSTHPTIHPPSVILIELQQQSNSGQNTHILAAKEWGVSYRVQYPGCLLACLVNVTRETCGWLTSCCADDGLHWRGDVGQGGGGVEGWVASWIHTRLG